MGANTFVEQGNGENPKQVFNALVEEAQFEYGHGGYTGSIAEKGGDGLKRFASNVDIDDILGGDTLSKWGPTALNFLSPHRLLVQPVGGFFYGVLMDKVRFEISYKCSKWCIENYSHLYTGTELRTIALDMAEWALSDIDYLNSNGLKMDRLYDMAIEEPLTA